MISNKLACWKRGSLSLGGRITLIKGVLSNDTVYNTLLYKAPVKVVYTIKKFQRDFLWEGGRQKKDHLIKWETVVQPKEYGGIGMGRIKEHNVALMGKWLWRFAVE